LRHSVEPENYGGELYRIQCTDCMHSWQYVV